MGNFDFLETEHRRLTTTCQPFSAFNLARGFLDLSRVSGTFEGGDGEELKR